MIVVLLTALLIATGLKAVPALEICGDTIEFWATGKLLAAGQSPYAPDLQAAVHRATGWDRSIEGGNRYDFVPFYYPPWLAMLCTPLALLSLENARVALFVINIELLLLAGYLLRDAVPGVPRSVPLVVVPTLAFSVAAVVIGQTSPLILALVAGAWTLLRGARDRSAGAVLAWLTVKPQLTVLLLPGVLLWAMRRGRWGVLLGFGAMLALLVALSTAILPRWPLEMLHLVREIPPPTAYFPGMGGTSLSFLTAIGLGGWVLRALNGVIVLVAVALVLRAALERDRPLHDVLALGLLAAFFVAPYGRYYDYPVLVVPFLVLVGRRLPEKAATMLLLALYGLSFGHYFMYLRFRRGLKEIPPLEMEFLFFWVPLLLAAAWVASRTERERAPEVAAPARRA